MFIVFPYKHVVIQTKHLPVHVVKAKALHYISIGYYLTEYKVNPNKLLVISCVNANKSNSILSALHNPPSYIV